MEPTEIARTMLSHGPFWWLAIAGTGMFGIRYFAIAGIAFSVWYRGGAKRKLQAAMPRGAQIRRELGYSIVAILIFGAAYGTVFSDAVVPYTQLYWNVADRGWIYFWLSIPLMIVMHDAWFYWTHRLLHTRALFRLVHGVHHLSRNPDPWTSYAFHPYESVVEALGVVVIIFTLPSHPLALLIFQTISTLYNAYGHLGYELYPRNWSRHWLGRWINTSVAHNAHHEKARHNFGFYFLFWDRWMGTLDPDYEARYRENVAV